MRTLLGLLAVLALTLAGVTATTTATAASTARVADRDCGDFSSQAAAQNFYLKAGGPQSDPHRLDADDDGIACDSNPCPCSTRQTTGDGPVKNTEPDRPKPLHVVRQLDAGGAPKGRIYVTAKVLTYRGKPVQLQRSQHRGRGYRTFLRERTHRGGKFRVAFRARVGTHVRLLVPGTARNRPTTVYVGRVTRR